MRQLISLRWRLLFGSLFSLLTTIGLLGNILVIVAILGDKKMRKSVMNLLLLNLAIADGLNLVTTAVEWTPTIALGSPSWIPGLPRYLCPVARYFECVFLFTSILTQLTVCIERYIAIVFPIHARRLCSRNNILITICAIWLTTGLIAVPYALHNKIRQNTSVCANVHASSDFWLHYKWLEFLSLYLLPCLVFLCLYSKICAVLWAKNRQLYEGQNNVGRAHNCNCSNFRRFRCSETKKTMREGSLSDPSTGVSRSCSSAALLSAREEALKTRRNVVKMLVACVSIYFVCYSPIQAIFLSRGLFHVRIHPPYQFILLMNALAMLCSACNPLLYTLFSRRFRARIASLLCPYFGGQICAETENVHPTSGRGGGSRGSGMGRGRGGGRNGNGTMQQQSKEEEAKKEARPGENPTRPLTPFLPPPLFSGRIEWRRRPSVWQLPFVGD